MFRQCACVAQYQPTAHHAQAPSDNHKHKRLRVSGWPFHHTRRPVQYRENSTLGNVSLPCCNMQTHLLTGYRAAGTLLEEPWHKTYSVDQVHTELMLKMWVI